MEEKLITSKIWDFKRIDKYLSEYDASLPFTNDFSDIISRIIDTLNFASEAIKQKGYDTEKYDFLNTKLNEYKTTLSNLMGLEWTYEPSENEISVAFRKNYTEICKQAEEDDLRGILMAEIGYDDCICGDLDDSTLLTAYRDYIADMIVEQKILHNPHYSQYATLDKYTAVLLNHTYNDISERSILADILNYNREPEPLLNDYIKNGDVDEVDRKFKMLFASKIVCTSGKKVAAILCAFEECGYKFTVNDNKTQFYKDILSKRYGVTTSLQSIWKFYILKKRERTVTFSDCVNEYITEIKNG